MRGNVIGFDRDTNTGAISGHDGQRYDFVTLDWRAAAAPRRGDIVDFQAIGDRSAVARDRARDDLASDGDSATG